MSKTCRSQMAAELRNGRANFNNGISRWHSSTSGPDKFVSSAKPPILALVKEENTYSLHQVSHQTRICARHHLGKVKVERSFLGVVCQIPRPGLLDDLTKQMFVPHSELLLWIHCRSPIDVWPWQVRNYLGLEIWYLHR